MSTLGMPILALTTTQTTASSDAELPKIPDHLYSQHAKEEGKEVWELEGAKTGFFDGSLEVVDVTTTALLFHKKCIKLFAVLSGKVELIYKDSEHSLAPKQFIYIPRNTDYSLMGLRGKARLLELTVSTRDPQDVYLMKEGDGPPKSEMGGFPSDYDLPNISQEVHVPLNFNGVVESSWGKKYVYVEKRHKLGFSVSIVNLNANEKYEDRVTESNCAIFVMVGDVKVQNGSKYRFLNPGKCMEIPYFLNDRRTRGNLTQYSIESLNGKAAQFFWIEV